MSDGIFPQFVLTDSSTPPPSCEVTMDIEGASNITLTTVDDLTFDMSNIGNGLPDSSFFLLSSTDLLSLPNENEWISFSVTVGSLSFTIADMLDTSVIIGYINTDTIGNLNDTATVAQVSLSSIVLGYLTTMQTPNSFGNPELLFGPLYNDPLVNLITGATFTASIKRDGSDFQMSATFANGETTSWYNTYPLIMPTYTEMYPTVGFLYAGSASGGTGQVTVSFQGDDLTHAKPSTATPCGGSLNTEAGASLPPVKTGQTTDFTPAGRTSQDDGGNQEGRLDKNSTAIDLSGTSFGTSYASVHEYGTGQYQGDTNIIFGTQNVLIDNSAIVVNKLGLMYNVSALDVPTIDFGWDDSGSGDDDIFEYCDQANLASLSGHNDWRVANMIEIISFLKYDGSVSSEGPLIPWFKNEGNSEAGFIPLPIKLWTSTTNTDKDDEAYTIDDKDGQVKKRKKNNVNADFSVILVRNTQRDAV